MIVVEQEDGTFKSTPFHVRFGKMGVLKAKEKIVSMNELSEVYTARANESKSTNCRDKLVGTRSHARN